jgi:hypothetical protein
MKLMDIMKNSKLLSRIVVTVVVAVGGISIGYLIMSSLTLTRVSKDIIPGDISVEVGTSSTVVDPQTMNTICTFYYETVVYAENGHPLRRYITRTLPHSSGAIVRVEDGSYDSVIWVVNGVTIISSKKVMPISWMFNSMGETSYDGRRPSHYNHYLEGKRTIAPVWDEDWWELTK